MTAWRSGPLTDDHDTSTFASGQPPLDRWLVDHASRAARAGVAHTTVWTPGDDLAVVAYHAIAPTQLARIELPSRSFSAGYSTVPGYLIGRLALDRTLHGRGLGTELLLDALERIVEAADAAGGRIIVVDAIDESAHAFYRHHDFRPVEGTLRLVMKLSTARAALDTGA